MPSELKAQPQYMQMSVSGYVFLAFLKQNGTMAAQFAAVVVVRAAVVVVVVVIMANNSNNNKNGSKKKVTANAN